MPPFCRHKIYRDDYNEYINEIDSIFGKAKNCLLRDRYLKLLKSIKDSIDKYQKEGGD